jgi:hypothetical protein
MIMSFTKMTMLIGLLLISSCAEIGIKPHKPLEKSTSEIRKAPGTYRIVTIKGGSSEIDFLLNKDIMKCHNTTFSMPRGHTVSSFIREVFEQELTAADKLSLNGAPIEVIVKAMNLTSTSLENGEWTMEFEYSANDKKTNIKNTIEFTSKVSMLSSCVHTSMIFEDTIADNLVEFFKRL